MNWLKEVEKRKEELLKDTQDLLRIKSVLDEQESKSLAPFGEGIKEALDFTLQKCEQFGFKVKNLEGYAGHAEFGEGDEILGILCHLDVVPEGDGWTYPPYEAIIEDGKLYARGAIDDKGPTMAAIYALRIIKELDIKLNKKVRIIFGTDEESGWRGIDYYFEKEKMPALGFAPDADFPIIITEKGIANIEFTNSFSSERHSDLASIASFTSGRRANMVPDFAVTELTGEREQLKSIQESFEDFLNSYSYGGNAEITNEGLTLKLNGVSAHGMEPFKGVNAGLTLIHFLSALKESIYQADWILWADKYLYEDFYGKALGIAYEDKESGKLTVNTGVIQYKNNQLAITINIRYPITTEYESMITQLGDIGKELGLQVKVTTNSSPHHVDKNHFLVQTLKKVYEKQTNEEAKLLAIGGGTYSRALKTGVAFGPLFPGKEETAHQKNEYIEIDDFLRATAIYAEAIYELAK